MESKNNPTSDLETAGNNPRTTTHDTPKSNFPAKVIGDVRKNLVFQSKWAELNGAMGDLGTYIPIVLALTLVKDLNLGVTLIFNGIYNIITGAIYGVPMPVQPMKSIAAETISSPGFGIPEMMAAGILTGGILFLLGVTGLMRIVYKIVPLSVVRGIQLAQGLSFSMTAVKYVLKVQNFSKAKASGGNRDWVGLDGLILAVFCVVFIVVVNGAGEERENEERECEEGGEARASRGRIKRILFSFPSAFLIFLLGVIFGIIRKPKVFNHIKFGPSSIHIVKFTKHAWKQGFIRGTIPQLPLSILNSVIAVCKLSSDLFPGREFSVTSISTTVGLMNLAGCWVGVMPVCHGAGGLAGQYKFGGRTGGCVAVLGLAKMVLGLILGSYLAKILEPFPVGVLGVLLFFAGLELAMASRDMSSKEDVFVMLFCASVSLVGSNAALGFACGMVVYFLLRLRKYRRGQSWRSIWLDD